MCLVCLVYLTFLAIHTADFLFNVIRGDSSGTISVSLFKNPWINILKIAKAVPAMHAALYSLSVLDWTTGPGTCVPCQLAHLDKI